MQMDPSIPAKQTSCVRVEEAAFHRYHLLGNSTTIRTIHLQLHEKVSKKCSKINEWLISENRRVYRVGSCALPIQPEFLEERVSSNTDIQRWQPRQ